MYTGPAHHARPSILSDHLARVLGARCLFLADALGNACPGNAAAHGPTYSGILVDSGAARIAWKAALRLRVRRERRASRHRQCNLGDRLAYRAHLLAVRSVLQRRRTAGDRDAGRGGLRIASCALARRVRTAEHEPRRIQAAPADFDARLQPVHHCVAACAADGAARTQAARRQPAGGIAETAPAAHYGNTAVSDHYGRLHTADPDAGERHRILRGTLRQTNELQPQDAVRSPVLADIRGPARRPSVVRLARPRRGALDVDWIHDARARVHRQQVRARNHFGKSLKYTIEDRG